MGRLEGDLLGGEVGEGDFLGGNVLGEDVGPGFELGLGRFHGPLGGDGGLFTGRGGSFFGSSGFGGFLGGCFLRPWIRRPAPKECRIVEHFCRRRAVRHGEIRDAPSLANISVLRKSVKRRAK